MTTINPAIAPSRLTVVQIHPVIHQIQLSFVAREPLLQTTAFGNRFEVQARRLHWNVELLHLRAPRVQRLALLSHFLHPQNSLLIWRMLGTESPQTQMSIRQPQSNRAIQSSLTLSDPRSTDQHSRHLRRVFQCTLLSAKCSDT